MVTHESMDEITIEPDYSLFPADTTCPARFTMQGGKHLQQKVLKTSVLERELLYGSLRFMVTVSSEESMRSFFQTTRIEREISMDGSKLIDIGR
jgi:hypothetical protein